MKDIEKIVSELVVLKSNTLRFQCSNFINAGILSSDKMEAIRFLKTVFDFGLMECHEIIDRVKNGESFMAVTNDLDARKLS